MPIFILSLLIQVSLVVHVIKTGRNTIWIWVLVLLPAVGPIAYFIVELLPSLLGSRAARTAARGVRQAIDPGRDLRRATATAALTDTVEAKAKLAAELAKRGDHAAAIDAYRAGLKGLYEFDPTLLLGLAAVWREDLRLCDTLRRLAHLKADDWALRAAAIAMAQREGYQLLLHELWAGETDAELAAELTALLTGEPRSRAEDAPAETPAETGA